jgi:hypothetical protein
VKNSSTGQSWTAPGDISGTGLPIQIVRPLADNGGLIALPDGSHPKTVALVTTCSPADKCPIDNGDSAICAASPVSHVDERGFLRPPPGMCDIGAFEVQPNALPPSQPSGGGSGAPNPLPGARPPSSPAGIAPNPIPAPRP